MPFVTFVLGAIVGAISGLLFHRWWITPDIKQMRKHIKKLEIEIEGLTKFALRGWRIIRYKNGVLVEDEIIGSEKNKEN